MVLVVIVIVALAVWIYFSSGFGGVTAFFSKLIKWMIFLGILGAIVYIVWKIMQKPKVDLVETTKQDIIDAGMFSKPPMLKDIYFTGDKEHGEFKVGSIIGYCQIQSYKELNKLANLSEEQLKSIKDQGKDVSEYVLNEDCFVWKKWGFPFRLFETPKVLRTLEDEHSQLIGDVKVYAVSMIKKYDYYWPNRAYLDIARIDHSIIKEAWRGHIHEFLRDAVAISRKSVGMDSGHQKAIEERRLLKIPNPMENQERRGG